MSTSPQISPKSASPSAALSGLFSAAVRVVERRSSGDPAELLPSEASHVVRAVPKRVQEFAAGRSCARAALEYFGVRDFPLHPAPDRQPIWPSQFVGSITHTTGFCAAAVAARNTISALGLDSEVVGAATTDIWDTICRPEECAWIDSLPLAQRPAAVTLLFAAKEAVYKCQYPLTGEWLDFHDVRIEVVEWGGAIGEFSVHASRELRFARHAAWPIGGRYVFHEEFVSAGIAVPCDRSALQ